MLLKRINVLSSDIFLRTSVIEGVSKAFLAHLRNIVDRLYCIVKSHDNFYKMLLSLYYGLYNDDEQMVLL